MIRRRRRLGEGRNGEQNRDKDQGFLRDFHDDHHNLMMAQ
jgi:hypothetical protein